MNPLKSNQTDYFLLNWIRGICAILVVLGHARNFYPFRDFTRSGDVSGWNSVLLVPTGLAMESVSIFFLISGFLVGGQVWRNISARNFKWNRFLADRLTRLWVVLIPGLFVSELVRNIIEKNGLLFSTSRDSLLNFACNSAFLMPTRCEPFASNESLWSLGYEFYFYVVFALSVPLVKREMATRSRILHFIGLCVVILMFTPALLPLLLAWLCGFFIYLFSKRAEKFEDRSRFRQYWALSLISVATGVLLTSTLIDSEVTVILLMAAFGSSLVLLSTRYAEKAKKPSTGFRRILDFFGKTSFSIYVFHLPIIYLYYALLGEIDQRYDLVVIYLMSILTILTSAGFYFLFEKHTLNVRLIVYRLLRFSY